MVLANILSGFFRRMLLLVVFSTILLTAAFVGVLAIATSEMVRFNSRLPYYTLFVGGVFVLTIILLEANDAGGEEILMTAITVTVLSTIVVVLAVEGAFFAMRRPEEVIVSQLVVYFVGASLLAIGFGYWGFNHWREFLGKGGL